MEGFAKSRSDSKSKGSPRKKIVEDSRTSMFDCLSQFKGQS